MEWQNLCCVLNVFTTRLVITCSLVLQDRGLQPPCLMCYFAGFIKRYVIFSEHSLWKPMTNLSRRASLGNVPKSLVPESLFNCAMYEETDSPLFWSLSKNHNLSPITNGLGFKWFLRASAISLYVKTYNHKPCKPSKILLRSYLSELKSAEGLLSLNLQCGTIATWKRLSSMLMEVHPYLVGCG